MADNTNAKGLSRRAAAVLLAACTVAALALIILLHAVLIPLGIAFLAAYIVEPPIAWIERHGARRMFAVTGVYVALIVALVVGLAAILPDLALQTRELGALIKEKSAAYGVTWDNLMATGKAEDETRSWWDNFLDRGEADVPTKSGDADAALADGASTNAPSETAASVKRILNEHAGAFAEKAPELVMTAGRVVAGGVRHAFKYVAQTLLVFFYAFFFMLHFKHIRRAVIDHLPRARRTETLAVLTDVNNAVSDFFRGRFLMCVISAVVTSVGLRLSGIDYWLLLGLMGGFLAIIPVVGVAIAFVPAFALAVAAPSPWFSAVGVVATFAVVQGGLEPLVAAFVLSKAVRLHPVTVIVALLAGGTLFGPLGLIAAVPAASVLKTLGKRFLLPVVERHAAPVQDAVTDER